MKTKNWSRFLTFENYLQFLILSIPIFLITGPFLPDFFLTLSALSFLVFLVVKKKINFLNHYIFYIFLIFFFILIASSLLSDYPTKSLITSIGYLRFGIFIFVIKFLIDKDESLIKNLSNFLLGIFLILLFDSIFQKLTGSNIFGVSPPYGRVTSLFGDDIKLGGYIARLTPLFIATLCYLKSKDYYIFSIFIISIFLTFISGERISFLMNIFFLAGFIIVKDFSYKKKIFLFITPLIFILIALLNQEIRYRLITISSNQINLTNNEPFYKEQKQEDGNIISLHNDSTILPRVYHMYFETSVKIFKDNILIGSGPRTYPLKSKDDKYYTVSDHEGWINFVKKKNKRILQKLSKIHNDQIEKISHFKKFKELKENKNLLKNKDYLDWLEGHGISHLNFEDRIKDKAWLQGHGYINDYEYDGFTNISGVNSHPHNTYLQLLSETGLLGFFFVFTIWLLAIFKLFSKKDLLYRCLILGFVINFFPFFFSGNFFNNWLSILYFYPLGFLFKKI